MLVRVDPHPEIEQQGLIHETLQSSERAFIQANTIPVTLEEVRNNHIIPVFLKDNETAISQCDFIEAVMDLVSQSYFGERILRPSIRVSHPIKGRIPEAKLKPVNELQDWEKTVYYERMMFVIEIPSITDDISGQPVTYTIGGVKSYSEDNLYNNKGADEHFKLFCGFKVRACTNLSVWSDGFAGNIRVKTLEQLRNAVLNMLLSFNPVEQVQRMRSLADHSITDQQFAQLIGRC